MSSLWAQTLNTKFFQIFFHSIIFILSNIWYFLASIILDTKSNTDITSLQALYQILTAVFGTTTSLQVVWSFAKILLRRCRQAAVQQRQEQDRRVNQVRDHQQRQHDQNAAEAVTVVQPPTPVEAEATIVRATAATTTVEMPSKSITIYFS